MDQSTLNIVNIVGSTICAEAEDGQRVFDIVKRVLSEKRVITLSFLNVEMLTTAFLNTAIGQLYRDFTEQEIRNMLKVADMTPSGLVSLKRVVDTAKLYYKDPDAMRRSINDILGE